MENEDAIEPLTTMISDEYITFSTEKRKGKWNKTN